MFGFGKLERAINGYLTLAATIAALGISVYLYKSSVQNITDPFAPDECLYGYITMYEHHSLPEYSLLTVRY